MKKIVHRGAVLKTLIQDINPNRTKLIQVLGINNKTLYNYYRYPDLPWPTIVKIVNVLKKEYTNVDEKKYFKDIPDKVALTVEDFSEYESGMIKKLQGELSREKENYISSLEREAALLRKGMMQGIPQLVELMQTQNKLLKQLLANLDK